jgi:hypothetical protein
MLRKYVDQNTLQEFMNDDRFNTGLCPVEVYHSVCIPWELYKRHSDFEYEYETFVNHYIKNSYIMAHIRTNYLYSESYSDDAIEYKNSLSKHEMNLLDLKIRCRYLCLQNSKDWYKNL